MMVIQKLKVMEEFTFAIIVEWPIAICKRSFCRKLSFATVKGIEFTNEKYSFTKTTSLRYDLQMMLT